MHRVGATRAVSRKTPRRLPKTPGNGGGLEPKGLSATDRRTLCRPSQVLCLYKSPAPLSRRAPSASRAKQPQTTKRCWQDSPGRKQPRRKSTKPGSWCRSKNTWEPAKVNRQSCPALSPLPVEHSSTAAYEARKTEAPREYTSGRFWQEVRPSSPFPKVPLGGRGATRITMLQSRA